MKVDSDLPVVLGCMSDEQGGTYRTDFQRFLIIDMNRHILVDFDRSLLMYVLRTNDLGTDCFSSGVRFSNVLFAEYFVYNVAVGVHV